jgi:alpha-methylacyl-CoA racemase
MEPRFYLSFMVGLGFSEDEMPPQNDPSLWEDLTRQVAAIIRTGTRAQWLQVFDGTDACVSPVLSLGEAPDHPHNAQRSTFVDVGGVVEPAPAPRFSRTPAPPPSPAPEPGVHGTDALEGWGFTGSEITLLTDAGIID